MGSTKCRRIVVMQEEYNKWRNKKIFSKSVVLKEGSWKAAWPSLS